MELVHYFGDCHEVRHRAEWLAAEIGIRSRQNHAATACGKGADEPDDALIEKLRFVDCDDVRHRIDLLRDLGGRIGRNGFDRPAVVAGNGINAGVALVEV